MSRLLKQQAVGRYVECVRTGSTYCPPTVLSREALSMSGGLDSTTVISVEFPGFRVQLSFLTDLHLLVNVWTDEMAVRSALVLQ